MLSARTPSARGIAAMCGRLDDDRSRHNGAVAIDVPRVRVTVARDDARSKSPGAADHRNGATAADWTLNDTPETVESIIR